MLLTLSRVLSTPEGMTGILHHNGHFLASTIERPWLDNKPYVSCIPAGLYKMVLLDNSPSFSYRHLWLQDIKDRTWIKIHRANEPRELHGCIALGDRSFKKTIGVANSEYSLNYLMAYIEEHYELDVSINIIEHSWEKQV